MRREKDCEDKMGTASGMRRERRTSDEETVGRGELLESFVEGAARVLEAMRLVDGEVVPAELDEVELVLEDDFVRGEENVEARDVLAGLVGIEELPLADDGTSLEGDEKTDWREKRSTKEGDERRGRTGEERERIEREETLDLPA